MWEPLPGLRGAHALQHEQVEPWNTLGHAGTLWVKFFGFRMCRSWLKLPLGYPGGDHFIRRDRGAASQDPVIEQFDSRMTPE